MPALLVPLFSIPSRAQLGHRRDSGPAARSARGWRTPGFSFVQLLPLNEMADGQNSPYSALSAMAIDPIFIAPAAVPEIEALGGEALLDAEERRASSRSARERADDRLRGACAR